MQRQVNITERSMLFLNHIDDKGFRRSKSLQMNVPLENTERLAERLNLIYTCHSMTLIKRVYQFLFEIHCTQSIKNVTSLV